MTLGVVGPVITVVGSVFAASCRHRGTHPSYVDLDSPGVVKLDTSVVPDVLGLRAFYDNAELVRVLPGRARTPETPERSPRVSGGNV